MLKKQIELRNDGAIDKEKFDEMASEVVRISENTVVGLARKVQKKLKAISGLEFHV